MLTTGYVKFSRGWKHDPLSPFYGAKYRRYYEVWRELCEQASYDDAHGQPKGVVSMSVRELSAAVDQPRQSCMNAITYCERIGLLRVCETSPRLKLLVTHYDLLESVPDYIQKIAVFDAASVPHKKSGTVDKSLNKPISLVNLDHQKTIWDTDKKSGTHLGQEGQCITMRNDEDNKPSKKPSGTHLGQNRPFFKNNNNNSLLLLHKSSEGTSAHADSTPTIKAKRIKKTPTKLPPTDWQVRVGSMWTEHLAKLFPGVKQDATKQVAGLQAVQAKYPDLDEALIERVLLWARGHRHWKRAILNLGGLMNAYRFADGAPKLLAMVADMEAERERQTKAPPKRTWAGDEV